MIRTGEVRSAALRMVAIAAVAMLLAAPRTAAAQAAPPQEDILKLNASVPTVILIQINAEKSADFEAAWGAMRAALAKSTKDDEKAFGDSLGKLFKVDQPPIEGKTVIYLLNMDAPSTTISYNPFKIIYETMWKNGATEGALATRAEADALFEKVKAALQNINPPWKLAKVG